MYVGVQNECIQYLCILALVSVHCPCPLYIVSVMCSIVVCFPHVGWKECSPHSCMAWSCQHYPVPCTQDAVSTPQHWQQRVHLAALGSWKRPCWSGSTSDRWVPFWPHCSYQGVWSYMRCLVKSSRASGGLCNACGRCACDKCVNMSRNWNRFLEW